MPASIWSELERISGKSYGDYTLLNLCLDVHMSSTGASDVLPYPLLDEAVRVLERAVSEWREGNLLTITFDNTVRALCVAAIAEGKAEIQRMTETNAARCFTVSEPFEIVMPA